MSCYISNLEAKMAAPETSRKTLDKALALLMEFSNERPELAVSELSERLGMHKSIVSRLAASLRAWGMLELNPVSGRLRIGPAAFRIGTLFSQRNMLAELAMPLLADLVHRTGHSAHLSVLDGLRILVIATVESPNALRVIMRVGDQRHLHATAAGKLFLALSPPDLLGSVRESLAKHAFTPQTIVKAEHLVQEFPGIRRTKQAMNLGESHIGIGAIAAAVLSSTDEMLGAISTVFPLGIVDKAEQVRIADHTSACAQVLANKFYQSRYYSSAKPKKGD